MARSVLLLLIFLLLAGCSGHNAGDQKPPHTDTGSTVPEDVVPEHLKPGVKDSADSF